jgi:hypothetical protein
MMTNQPWLITSSEEAEAFNLACGEVLHRYALIGSVRNKTDNTFSGLFAIVEGTSAAVVLEQAQHDDRRACLRWGLDLLDERQEGWRDEKYLWAPGYSPN